MHLANGFQHRQAEIQIFQNIKSNRHMPFKFLAFGGTEPVRTADDFPRQKKLADL